MKDNETEEAVAILKPENIINLFLIKQKEDY